MIGSNSLMHKHLTALHSLHASVGVPVPSFRLPMPLVMGAVGAIRSSGVRYRRIRVWFFYTEPVSSSRVIDSILPRGIFHPSLSILDRYCCGFLI